MSNINDGGLPSHDLLLTLRHPQLLDPANNTFSSSYIQKPLMRGADIRLHAAKSYGGDIGNPDVCKALSFSQNAMGTVPGPFSCWLAHRGGKTMHLRALAAARNARIQAETLNSLLVIQ
ncbi:hypothetical protein ANOM_009887, partial [Aspergillus nomiae NRRL 13137]